jgi:DNA helicase-2/ATP-dependent DNA helicase PcrA
VNSPLRRTPFPLAITEMTAFNPFSDDNPESDTTALAIDFGAELNPEQHAAVTSPPGPALVLAGAGSGKTRTLTYRVAWLLSQGVRPEEILLLTFTNKAAKEMLGRVEELTGVASWKFWGGTFHHIGQKILRQFGEPVQLGPGFTIMDESDAESLLQQVIKEEQPAFLKSKENPKAKLIGNIISYKRNTRLSLGEVLRDKYPEYENFLEDFTQFHGAYRQAKRERQVVDYDDLLECWLELLEKQPELSDYFGHRFRHLLVDEYQDTNALQSAIIDRMAPHHRIMAVGDDAQCIYTWRGADYENIMSFPDRHPGTQIHKIETNYRSTPNILDYANSVLQNQPRGKGYAKELKAVRSRLQEPMVIQTLDTQQQASFVIQRIQNLVNDGHSLSDMAVLYRAHYHAMDLQVELSRLGIPFQITSGIRFFEQAHVRDVTAQLRFVCNPTDTTAFQRFSALIPKIGPRTSDKLLALARGLVASNGGDIFGALASPTVCQKVPADGQEDWVGLTATLLDLRTALKTERPMRVVEIAVEGWYDTYLRRTFTNAKSREDDLQSLVAFAQKFSEMTELLAQLVLLSSETGQKGYENREEQVRLTTIHQAKGLEFPIVFVIGLGDGWFPLRRAIESGEIEEERRLFYVAVTRAKDELYLVHPRITGGNGPTLMMPPSRFIEEVAPQLFSRHSLFKSYSRDY